MVFLGFFQSFLFRRGWTATPPAGRYVRRLPNLELGGGGAERSGQSACVKTAGTKDRARVRPALPPGRPGLHDPRGSWCWFFPPPGPLGRGSLVPGRARATWEGIPGVRIAPALAHVSRRPGAQQSLSSSLGRKPNSEAVGTRALGHPGAASVAPTHSAPAPCAPDPQSRSNGDAPGRPLSPARAPHPPEATTPSIPGPHGAPS